MEQVLPLHLRSLPKLVIMNPMANFTMLVPYMVTNFFFFVSTNSTWQTASYKMDNSNSFGYGLGNSKDVAAKDPEDYVVGYDLPNRQSSTGDISFNLHL